MDALNKAEAESVLIPCIGWLRRYQKDWLRLDVMAGLTAAAVVIPKAMAYATIAGLPVQVGLYTVFLPMLIYAALGPLCAQRKHHHHDRHSDRRLLGQVASGAIRPPS